jgi:heme exporter protein D
MTDARSHADADPGDGRDETPNERYDRNWSELLQEFRVMQTGTQILAGFLLTLPFQQRFGELAPFEVGVYLGLVFLAVAVTVLALSPVALHRVLFRHKAKKELVAVGSRIMIVCLAAASLLFAGIALFVFTFVAGDVAGWIACAAVLLVLAVFWLVIPLRIRRRSASLVPPA